MKYIFRVYVFGTPVDSKPLTKEELIETISVYLANDIHNFEVHSTEENI